MFKGNTKACQQLEYRWNENNFCKLPAVEHVWERRKVAAVLKNQGRFQHRIKTGFSRILPF